jgi:RNA polymerase sigma factor (sigma-70 family)
MKGNRADPLAEVETLVEDVFAYIAYRVGARSEAEEITSAVFERAVRYRHAYDRQKGSPIEWLIGIARRQIADSRSTRPMPEVGLDDSEDGYELETETLERLALHDAVRLLDERSRELIALRYGIGLSTSEIAAHVGLAENAVNVALHRARARLRGIIDGAGNGGRAARRLIREET